MGADRKAEEQKSWRRKQVADHEMTTFLQSHGFVAHDSGAWDQIPQFLWQISITHHEECLLGHTWYSLQCSLVDASGRTRNRDWTITRRLSMLRAELHDPVKAELGNEYSSFFSATPFARHGGPRGTTERLRAWLQSFADHLNTDSVTPGMVTLALTFLQAPFPNDQSRRQPLGGA